MVEMVKELSFVEKVCGEFPKLCFFLHHPNFGWIKKTSRGFRASNFKSCVPFYSKELALEEAQKFLESKGLIPKLKKPTKKVKREIYSMLIPGDFDKFPPERFYKVKKK